MRVTYNGVVSFGARQTILTIGNRYLVQGKYRADGVTVVTPVVNVGTNYSIGVANNMWQTATLDDTCTHNDLYLFSGGVAAGYVEFDSFTATNLSITSLTPRIGAPLTQATATAMPWVDSSTGQVRYQGGDLIQSTAPASTFKCLHDGTGGTLVVAVKPRVLQVATKNVYVTTTAISMADVGSVLFEEGGLINFRVINGAGYAFAGNSSGVEMQAGTTAIITARIVSGTNGVSVRKNSVQKISGTLVSPSAADPTLTLNVGGRGTTECLDGLIPDCAVYPRVLTDSECLRVERYMYRQAEGRDPTW